MFYVYTNVERITSLEKYYIFCCRKKEWSNPELLTFLTFYCIISLYLLCLSCYRYFVYIISDSGRNL